MEKRVNHRRKCTRPAYREPKKDISARVYTINQESRHLLVKGIPAISNIEGDVLELFSPHGNIEEFKVLDEYPREEFTNVYWIRYSDIQAARVAKRKLNKKSFFGSFLNVVYAPEYESIEDTRKKLQQRRISIARRIRQLQRDSHDEGVDEESSAISSASGSTTAEDKTDAHEVVKQPLPTAHQVSSHLPSQSSITSDSTENVFPSLPDPPQHLPPWQWRLPQSEQNSDLRRVPSAHATLPPGFDPYPEDNIEHKKENTNTNGQSKSHIGPVLPPPSERLQQQYPVATGRVIPRNVQRRTFDGSGARPKLVPRRRFAWTNTQSQQIPGTSVGSSHVLGQRSRSPPQLARNLQGPAGESSRQSSGLQQVTTFLPREVARGRKRSREDTVQETVMLPPATGSASFDQTVSHLRQRITSVTPNLSQPSTSRHLQDRAPQSVSGSLDYVTNSSVSNHHHQPAASNHPHQPAASNHAQPPASSNHAQPSASSNHAQPSASSNHAQPPASSNHVQPPTDNEGGRGEDDGHVTKRRRI